MIVRTPFARQSASHRVSPTPFVPTCLTRSNCSWSRGLLYSENMTMPSLSGPHWGSSTRQRFQTCRPANFLFGPSTAERVPMVLADILHSLFPHRADWTVLNGLVDGAGMLPDGSTIHVLGTVNGTELGIESAA